jgi:hypothetical protein
MSNAPKYFAYSVKERGNGKKGIWTRIGAAWDQQKGGGINIELEALPLAFDGKIVLLPPKVEAETFGSEVAQ